LPADHHARWLRSVVAHLDLSSFRRSYAGYGSLAYPVELLLAFVLFMYSKGILCAAKWREAAKYDDQARWLLRGLQPSRAVLYRFRDRVEPFLDDWHAQILAWAIFEKITTAQRGSLDGTLIAALRHGIVFWVVAASINVFCSCGCSSGSTTTTADAIWQRFWMSLRPGYATASTASPCRRAREGLPVPPRWTIW